MLQTPLANSLEKSSLHRKADANKILEINWLS